MSYMNDSAVFTDGIQELSFDEIDEVNGGLAPLIVAGLVVGGIILICFAAGVAAGYYANE
ncbi:MAG: hypothetical protein RLZZ427_494 [Pseudomonadota bacterium]